MDKIQRLVALVGSLFLAILLAALAGCGGGSTAPAAQLSPVVPDFAIAISTSSVSVAQGATSAPVTLTVTAQNNFSGNVQVTLSGLPAGVISNPVSPFSVAAGVGTPVVFGASSTTATGSFMISAQGSSGALSHAASLSLTVQAGVAAGPVPRSTFARTDANAALDNPAGEALHRHIVYDAQNKHVFVANRAMNRVEVFSSTTQTRVAQINVPGASSAEISADGATVWVGTVTQQAVAIDSASLQIKSRSTIPAVSPIPNVIFDRPEELLALASGKLLVRLRQPNAAQALLGLWDPAAQTLNNLTAVEPQLFQNGLGAMARTGDHTKVVIAASDSSGEIAIFDASGNVLAGPHGLGDGTIPVVAANADGSRFAAAFVAHGVTQIELFDGSFTPAGPPVLLSAGSLAFSRDGRFLYAAENSATSPVISVFDEKTLAPLGQVADLSIQGVQSEIEDVDETQMVFALSNRGVSFLDAANPSNLPATAPMFASAPVAQPAEGPAVGGTTVALAGMGYAQPTQIKLGTQQANNVTSSGSTQIQAVSPPSAVTGAVNATAYFSNGWLAIAPDAFSYGTQILKVLPNAGAKTGGDSVQIYGYGFGSDTSKIAVSIGGTAAAVQKVENVSGLSASLGLDATFPFSLERITLQTPVGTVGKNNVMVTSPAGSATGANAFQYLQSVQVFPKAGLYKFLLYDQPRQWIYLSATDHVDTFDLAVQQFHSSSIFPPGGPPPNAGLRGLSLTPDGTQLVVADFGAQKIYLLNPDSGTGSSVVVGGVAGFAASGPARVAATSTQTVFVGLSGEGGPSTACASCLSQLDLTATPPTIQPAPQPEVTSIVGAPLVQGNAAGDKVFVAFGAAPSASVAVWNAADPNNFTTSSANEVASDLAPAADGSAFAMRVNGATETRSGTMALLATAASAEIEQIPGRMMVPGIAMHPSGALIYQPFLTGAAPSAPGVAGNKGGVDILDAHSGRLRLRIFLPEPLAMLATDTDGLHGQFLTIDENGERIFALTTSGLTVIQLSAAPLGLGTILPASGSAAGGTTVIISGSGFQSGTTVTIGGKAAAVTFKDKNTISVVTPAMTAGARQIVIANPDGESFTLDAAFAVN
ncbi:MAG TPA: IPT/TIG domain-containing protein [Candidatus Acidoferrum sp.]|jgi:hypothetical protein